MFSCTYHLHRHSNASFVVVVVENFVKCMNVSNAMCFAGCIVEGCVDGGWTSNGDQWLPFAPLFPF